MFTDPTTETPHLYASYPDADADENSILLVQNPFEETNTII